MNAKMPGCGMSCNSAISKTIYSGTEEQSIIQPAFDRKS
jgi:hypothetical protein